MSAWYMNYERALDKNNEELSDLFSRGYVISAALSLGNNDMGDIYSTHGNLLIFSGYYEFFFLIFSSISSSNNN